METVSDLGEEYSKAIYDRIKSKDWKYELYKNVITRKDRNPVLSSETTNKVVWVDPADPNMEK